MSKFFYEARDSSGRMDSGVLTAVNADEVSRMLRKDGKTVVSVRDEDVALNEYANSRRIKTKITRDDIIFFATQLAVMVDTGVPLVEALDSIAAQSESDGLKAVVRELSDDIKSGSEFSVALEKHPKLFDNLFVALMRASEASGSMGLMLQRLSDYLAVERETRKKIKGAMTYPICMLVFCILVVISLMVFILPRFEKIYAGKNAALPLPTRMLIGLSHGLIGYWPLWIGGTIAVVVGCYMYFKTPDGRLVLDRIKISTPILGSMYRKAALARSLRMMATMVSGGVGMLDVLDITAHAAGNAFYARIWTNLAEKISEGSSIADELFTCSLVPRTLTQMISAGEKTGRLAPVLDRIATFCEDDLKVAVRTVTNMIEPIMIIVMGVLVGGIAMALLLPVFSISRVMTK